MFGFLRNWSQLTNVPAQLREHLEAEGLIYLAHKVGVSRHFSGHVPGVFSASGVSRYTGAFAFSVARVVATFPTRGDTNLRAIDCAWDTNKGPATATITNKGLVIDIGLHGVDPAFSGTMKLNYKRKIPDDVLQKLPTTTMRFRWSPSSSIGRPACVPSHDARSSTSPVLLNRAVSFSFLITAEHTDFAAKV